MLSCSRSCAFPTLGNASVSRSRMVLAPLRGTTENSPVAGPAPVKEVPAIKYDHVLVPILDPNNFLSQGSKQALATAAKLAQGSGKVTVLIVDEEGTKSESPTTRRDTISWHFRENNFENYSILEKDISTPASVLIGDVADDISSDLVLMSTEAVHAKHVDANQLAEFVSCPVLLIPF